jgi:hypothetical protein
MKVIKAAFYLLLLLIATALSACNTRKDETNNGDNSDTLRHISVDSIDLYWQPDSNDLIVKINAPTTGWIAVGFGPTMGMQDANIIIGYVRADTLFIRDDYGSSPGSHEADTNAGGTSDVTADSSVEQSGRTAIKFRIPLNSGDIRDRVLVRGTSCSIILAYGEDNADAFDLYHKYRVVTAIQL